MYRYYIILGKLLQDMYAHIEDLYAHTEYCTYPEGCEILEGGVGTTAVASRSSAQVYFVYVLIRCLESENNLGVCVACVRGGMSVLCSA